MTFAYLGALVISLLGTGLIDFRHRLAFFSRPLQSSISIGITVVVLLAIDLVGISLGIFFRGQTEYLSGILLAPELPLEEVFFLTLLSYTTLVVYLWAKRGSSK